MGNATITLPQGDGEAMGDRASTCRVCDGHALTREEVPTGDDDRVVVLGFG